MATSQNRPFFTIISVTFNDAWSLTKTCRSVYRQINKDFEYIIIDGNSCDGTFSLIQFWQDAGLVDKALVEPDTGVYDAMNKGVRLANGRYLCFMNAGDVFASDTVLQDVQALLQESDEDGILGWGELNGQYWSSWVATEGFKLASLGFCHQSLYVRKEHLERFPFDARLDKTDSDTLQLGRMFADGINIRLVPKVLAIRGGEPGLSANLERTGTSIVGTLTEEYPQLDEKRARLILEFRRGAHRAEDLLQLLQEADPRLAEHLSYMMLDTLFQRQSASLPTELVYRLYEAAVAALQRVLEHTTTLATLDGLLAVQSARANLLEDSAVGKVALRSQIEIFASQEQKRLAKLKGSINSHSKPGAYIVSLTSFPARLSTLHFVIQSLQQQSLPPQEIHLWLGQDEIPKRSYLPRTLLALEEQGLLINFVPKTCHQYDKFLHNAARNAKLPFVIVDDDVIYPPDAMQQLLARHSEFPGVVIANRCHLMALDPKGNVLPYADWPREVQLPQPSLAGFPTGAGGVLYPPGFLTTPPVTNIEAIMACASYADDVWLKVCGLLQGIPVMSTPASRPGGWYLRYTPTMTAGALHATNVDLGLNDIQIQRALAFLAQQCSDWQERLNTDYRELQHAV